MTTTTTYTSIPLEVPQYILQWLVDNGPSCNVVLPTLEKTIHTSQQSGRGPRGHLWVWIQAGNRVLAVAALSDTYMDTKYPLFIVSSRDGAGCDVATLELAKTLVSLSVPTSPSTQPVVSMSRIFSVFAEARTSKMFATRWQQLTGISILRDPYYRAWLSTVTAETLTTRFSQLGSDYWIGPANTEDVVELGHHCYEFASEGEPFVLDTALANHEAASMIEKGAVWVLKHDGNIVSSVSFTRTTQSVAAITKVFTPANYRSKGYARLLVRGVCHHLLTEKMHAEIALYVGVENPARWVYNSVGFQNLGNDEPTPDMEWLEIGFARDRVEIGHW